MIKYQQNMICSVDPRARLDMPEELKRLGANDKCFYQKVRLELLVLKKKIQNTFISGAVHGILRWLPRSSPTSVFYTLCNLLSPSIERPLIVKGLHPRIRFCYAAKVKGFCKRT